MTVRVALIRGPMYDPLYSQIEAFSRSTGIDMEFAFMAEHPVLNAHIASWVNQPDALPYDLISTHSKYFPSQLSLLAPLDGYFSAEDLADFLPLMLEMVRLDGQLYSLPRNIDVRLLHYRTDLIQTIPDTWDELLETIRAVNRPPEMYGFVFPGMESGLFGTFYELAEMGGAHLFPPDLIPDIENEGGRWALNFLRTCYLENLVPPEIIQWHYDKVHDFFRDGHSAVVGDWPGYYSDYCNPVTSAVAGRFALARYPKGPVGRSRDYGGGHTFAMTIKGAQSKTVEEVVALLRYLTRPEQQLLEARHGSVPVRQSVMREIQAEASLEEKVRWQILESVIQEDVLIPPKVAEYVIVEEVVWMTVQAAIVGKLTVEEALRKMKNQIRASLEGTHER